MKNPHLAGVAGMFYAGWCLMDMWQGYWSHALLMGFAAYGFFLVAIHICVFLNLIKENRTICEAAAELQQSFAAAHAASLAVLNENDSLRLRNATLQASLRQYREELLKARVIITGSRP